MTDDHVHNEAKSPRYMTFVTEVEIEVTDPVAAAAHSPNLGIDASGDLSMFRFSDQVEQMRFVLASIIGTALAEQGERAGFRFVGGSTFPRIREGSFYKEWKLVERPARGDDGKFPDEE